VLLLREVQSWSNQRYPTEFFFLVAANLSLLLICALWITSSLAAGSDEGREDVHYEKGDPKGQWCWSFRVWGLRSSGELTALLLPIFLLLSFLVSYALYIGIRGIGITLVATPYAFFDMENNNTEHKSDLKDLYIKNAV
jgi:hypothetical protein